CGKSFWSFDAAMYIALGWKYRGRRVQQGTVVYCALEGGAGFAARVEAWRQHHLAEHAEPVPFHLLDVPLDLVGDHMALMQTIREQVEELPVAAVFIDTLNRAMLGDENKSDDMAKFIRAADAIRVGFECLVGVIHHCGIVGSPPRGHTSLAGADDVQIRLSRRLWQAGQARQTGHTHLSVCPGCPAVMSDRSIRNHVRPDAGNRRSLTCPSYAPSALSSARSRPPAYA